MKHHIIMAALSLAAALSCSFSSAPLVDSSGEIELEVYNLADPNDLLRVLTVKSEGPVIVDITDSDVPQYDVWVRSEGFYTEVVNCEKGGTINIDLDPVPQAGNLVTGVALIAELCEDHPYDGLVRFQAESGAVWEVTADSMGRFHAVDLPPGPYTVRAGWFKQEFFGELIHGSGVDYLEIKLYYNDMIRAPNLYLYPEATTRVQVILDFPLGGEVIASEPEYGDGWHVQVSPNGIIDNQYAYLFYEVGMVPEVSARSGWVIDGTKLEEELRRLLSTYGFVGREIDDFVDYWVPRLSDQRWLVFYPQEIDKLITLSITPHPRSIRRVLWLVQPLEHWVSLPAPPDPSPFVRDGFTVVEWGLICPRCD